MKVQRVLATKGANVITIRPEATVREATRLLAEHNIGALVVTDDAGNPIGIVSERDIVREVARNEDCFLESVGRIMTKDLITGQLQDDLMSVANAMTERRFRHLPVMDGGKLVGIVSIGDVVKAQRDVYQGEVDTLQTQILADKA